jgi:hypothetical protein
VGVYTLVVVLGLLLGLALVGAIDGDGLGTHGDGLLAANGDRANGGGGRAVGQSRDRGRASRGRKTRAGGDLVQGLEELVGHARVLGEELLLDGGLHGKLDLHLLGSVGENGGFAAAHTLHVRSDAGEAVEALADGLATLLLGDDVVQLLLSISETRLVDTAGRDSTGSVVGGSHDGRVWWVVGIVGIVGCWYCRIVVLSVWVF